MVGNLSRLVGSNNKNRKPTPRRRSAAGNNPHRETLSATAHNRAGSQVPGAHDVMKSRPRAVSRSVRSNRAAEVVRRFQRKAVTEGEINVRRRKQDNENRSQGPPHPVPGESFVSFRWAG